MNSSYEEMSPDQQAAVDTIASEAGPFWLTGPAGTGKSYVINYLRENVLGCVVTATTGMAAQLIQGRTLHSFACIIPRKGVIRSGKADERMRQASMLIVDEASMMNELLLSELFERIRMAQASPKLVLVGDLLQLPPVEGNMLFESDHWDTFTELRLTENHRQHEGEFIEVLHKVRGYRVDDQVRGFVDSRTVPTLPDDCTHLMSLRRKVADRNDEKLRELSGKKHTFPWDTKIVAQDKVDRISFKNARFPETLDVKVGARVVMLTNHPDGDWVNGSAGYVTEIDPKGYISVDLDNGGTVSTARTTEELFDADGNVLASITQYPMMLAWALTIHKSQGMTLEKVGVDLAHHFAAGMTYVAMSRCRTAEGLYLTGVLQELKRDPRIVKYARRRKAAQAEAS